MLFSSQHLLDNWSEQPCVERELEVAVFVELVSEGTESRM